MDIVYREAITQFDIERAVKLVIKTYKAKNILPSGDGESTTLSNYLFLPSAKTFLALYDDTLVGTISLVKDSKDGLHMDSQYKAALNIFRNQKKSIAEITMFVIDDTFPHTRDTIMGGHIKMLVRLFECVLVSALESEIDVLCITVAPKHARLYELLNFTSIGEIGEYQISDDGNTAPGVPMALDLMKNKKSKKQVVGFFEARADWEAHGLTL